MDEWLNEGMNEWMKKNETGRDCCIVNKWTVGREWENGKNTWANNWMTERKKEWMRERMKERKEEKTNEWCKWFKMLESLTYWNNSGQKKHLIIECID